MRLKSDLTYLRGESSDMSQKLRSLSDSLDDLVDEIDDVKNRVEASNQAKVDRLTETIAEIDILLGGSGVTNAYRDAGDMALNSARRVAESRRVYGRSIV